MIFDGTPMKLVACYVRPTLSALLQSQCNAIAMHSNFPNGLRANGWNGSQPRTRAYYTDKQLDGTLSVERYDAIDVRALTKTLPPPLVVFGGRGREWEPGKMMLVSRSIVNTIERCTIC